MNFSKLLQVVFKKGNLLFLSDIPSAVIWLHPCTLSTQQRRTLCTHVVESQRGQASLKVQLTFLTRMVRSWTKSLRRLWRVWSSRAFNIDREAECGGLGVARYISGFREQRKCKQQISSYHGFFQSFEVLLWLLMSLMEVSVYVEEDGQFHHSGSHKLAYSHLSDKESRTVSAAHILSSYLHIWCNQRVIQRHASAASCQLIWSYNYKQLSLVSQRALPRSQRLQILRKTEQMTVSLKREEAAWPQPPTQGKVWKLAKTHVKSSSCRLLWRSCVLRCS